MSLTRLVLFSLLFQLCSRICDAQNQIKFQTALIWNQRYLAANDWGSIPLNNEGEGVNSKRYGGQLNYPPKTLEEGLIDNRKTIPRNMVKISIDLLNDADVDYKIQSISLEVEKLHLLNEIDYEIGVWDLDPQYGYLDEFEFSITENGKIPDIHPGKLKILTEDKEQDPRLSFKIRADKNLVKRKLVVQFSLKVVCLSLGQRPKKYIINSDKSYFLAAL